MTAEAAEELRNDIEPILDSLKLISHVIVRERQNKLPKAPSDIRMCDPPKHIKRILFFSHYINY